MPANDIDRISNRGIRRLPYKGQENMQRSTAMVPVLGGFPIPNGMGTNSRKRYAINFLEIAGGRPDHQMMVGTPSIVP